MARARPRRFRNAWRVQYEDAEGVRRAKCFPRLVDAEKFLIDQQAQVERIKAGLASAPPKPRRFDELCSFWLANKTVAKRSPKDDTSIIEAHLRPSFGALDLVEVNVERVLGYQRGRRHLSDKTVHNHLTLLKSMLNLAVEMGWLVAAPRIKKPALVEEEFNWLRSTEEITAILRAADEEPPGVMELYATAVYTGMRAGELLGLRWDDVDLEGRLITVKRSYDKPTKTGAIRHVPILDPLLPVLRAWKLRCWSPAFVFPSTKGTMLQPSARVLQETLRDVQTRAGREEAARITFHDFRHTFASQWMMGGGDLFRLQRILGHKSPQMTNRYAHLAPDVFKEDYGRLADAVPKEGVGQVLAFANGNAAGRGSGAPGVGTRGKGKGAPDVPKPPPRRKSSKPPRD